MGNGFEKLLSPIGVGPLDLKNRMVMPPMTMCYANENDGVSQQQINYFTERAKGGVAMIIVGGVTVEGERGKLMCPSPLLRLDDNKYVAGFNRLVESVQEYGAKTAIQLYHAGRQTTLQQTHGLELISSSDVSTLLMGAVPMPEARAMTLDEIEQMEDAYAAAALRAKTAGFDAVLIDGGGGYGIAQFMSPFVNKRTDDYGGDLEGRMRFPLRVVEKIKAVVGENYPLFFDLPTDELIEGGIRPEESKVMAQMLEKAGISAFRMHVALYETYQYVVPPASVPRGVNVEAAKVIKDSLSNAKVMVGHRINNPQLAEEILRKDMADIILLGRPLIADPEFPKKTAEGRPEDIRPCIGCNIGCGGRIVVGIPASCTVNPSVGKEAEYRLTPADSPKKTLIVGGGVAGMEAARVAALRGHDVTLCEKNDKLGGQANVAAIPPHKYEIKGLVDYYKTRMDKCGIAVELNTSLTAEDILERKPDAVIVAAGAEPPEIDGFPGAKTNRVFTAWDVLLGNADIGDQVVIIGGGQVGLETAEFLAARGKKVTVLEMLPDIGADMELFTKIHLLPRIAVAGIELAPNTKVDEITPEGVRAGERVFPADTVVLSTGQSACEGLMVQLQHRVPELFAVGDCTGPRRLLNAIHEGARVARHL